MMGLLIQTDGSFSLRLIEGHLDIAEAVGGDFDWTSPGAVTMYCYEYALFEMPNNPVATALYHETHPGITDPLHGPVLVLGPVKDENDTDVPQQIVTRAGEIRAELTQEEIDRLAVPMTPQEQTEFQMRMIAAGAAATEALNRGQAVDFGGIMISGQPADNPPIDGNRRQGK